MPLSRIVILPSKILASVPAQVADATFAGLRPYPPTLSYAWNDSDARDGEQA
ncbi:MAG TPA: hypothetical protein VGP93_01350 [Polyangiaceae bacterium]|nr:hypothetical protein [Polyangiaceae bacterium]